MGRCRVCSRLRIGRAVSYSVHARHVDIEQDHGELVLQELSQRLLARAGEHDVRDIVEHGLDREQVPLVSSTSRMRARSPFPSKCGRLRLRTGSSAMAIPLPPPAREEHAAPRAPDPTRSRASISSMSTGLAM